MSAAAALKRTPARPVKPADETNGWFLDVVRAERDALDAFIASVPAGIDAIVRLIASQMRPIVCLGMGKSGLVAAKLAATFSSLGTPAFFLNAAEAAHGDLGAIQTGNLVILFSNSGTTDEILRILPLLKARDCTLVGVVGRSPSPLAGAVDHLILANVTAEADHIGMAPTASTTLQMAIGDALAVAASRARNFTRADFLRHHPAGLLGRQSIPIRHLMRTGDDLPVVYPHTSAAELLAVVSAKRLGAACVIDWENRLLGLIVDGDIRRLVQARQDLYAATARDLMQPHPTVIVDTATVGDVLVLLEAQGGPLAVLPVVDTNGSLQGMLHTYDVAQAKG